MTAITAKEALMSPIRSRQTCTRSKAVVWKRKEVSETATKEEVHTPTRKSDANSCKTDGIDTTRFQLLTDNDVCDECPAIQSSKSIGACRSVQFSTMEIREYPIIVGDNPGALSGGTPITIDWQYDPQTRLVVSVDDYQKFKGADDTPARFYQPSEREKMLRRLGFSRGEIIKARREADAIQEQRARTTERLKLCSVEETVERMQKKLLNLTFFRGDKRQERELLSAYRVGNARE